MKKKTVALLLACVMALGVAIGGTMAWLVDSTGEVKNTFTVGDINIDLKEHDYVLETKTLDTTVETTANADYHFVPGDTLPKDPFVKVQEGSEDCYLFIKVVETGNIEVTGKDAGGQPVTEKALKYTIDTDVWTVVPGHDGYWYKVVTDIPDEIGTDDDPAVDEYQTYNILTNKEVKVSQYITKDSAMETAKPTISFWAAAVQKDHIADVAAAWAELPAGFKPANP